MNKEKFKIDWKYIIRETLLIVISKIKDEINNNSEELEKARNPNQKIVEAFNAYSVIPYFTISLHLKLLQHLKNA